MPEEPKQKQIQIKVDDKVLKGVYANLMRVMHSKEEFVLEFANVFPPTGIMTARVIISPGHLKRIIKALVENLGRYEAKFGKIQEAEPPKAEVEFEA